MGLLLFHLASVVSTVHWIPMRTGDGIWLHGFFTLFNRQMDKISLNFLFSSTNNSCSLSPVSEMLCSSPFLIFTIFHELASMQLCLSCSGKLSTGCSFIAAEQRGIITPIRVLPTLPNESQYAVGLLCCNGTLLAVNFAPTRTPGHFSAKLLFSWSAPKLYRNIGFFFPRCTWHFSILNFIVFLMLHFSSFLRSLWTTSTFVCSISLSCHLQTFWGWCLSHHLSHSWTCKTAVPEHLFPGHITLKWSPNGFCTTVMEEDITSPTKIQLKYLHCFSFNQSSQFERIFIWSHDFNFIYPYWLALLAFKCLEQLSRIRHLKLSHSSTSGRSSNSFPVMGSAFFQSSRTSHKLPWPFPRNWHLGVHCNKLMDLRMFNFSKCSLS